MLFLSNLLQAKRYKRFIIIHLLLLLFFTRLYYLSYKVIKDDTFKTDKTETMTFYDFFYFTLITQATIGYGDIVPIHPLTKMINILQIFSISYMILLQ